MLAVIILSFFLESVVILDYFDPVIGEILLYFLNTVEVIPFFVQLLFLFQIKFVLDLIRCFLAWISLDGQ
jgi:hypothetical protein